MEKYYMAAMGGAEGFGNKSIKKLVDFCGSAKEAWSADIDDLIHAGVQPKPLNAFINFRGKHPNAPEKLVKYCERHEFNLCSFYDEDYPPILKELNKDTPPMFFYYRGKLEPRAERIGIVGSRENTQYGQNVALDLGEQLAAAGLTVVSGAARGIDTFAHRGALRTGRTVAVLGCGIEIAFRSGKKKFFEQMIERGVVLSEFPPQLPPNQGTFPPRNRIIAGLCRGIIVVEAGKKSGALITSDLAVGYDRDVFAIPGQIYSEKSIGCNELIRAGATLIKNAQDVLDEYNIKKSAPIIKTAKVEGIAAKVLDIIPSDEFITDDEILERIDEINPNELPNIMIELEQKKCIVEENGRYKKIEPKNKIVKAAKVEGIAAKILEIIPFDNFISDEGILEQIEEVNPNELPGIMLELEMKGCVTEDAGRYKRKVGG